MAQYWSAAETVHGRLTKPECGAWTAEDSPEVLCEGSKILRAPQNGDKSPGISFPHLPSQQSPRRVCMAMRGEGKVEFYVKEVPESCKPKLSSLSVANQSLLGCSNFASFILFFFVTKNVFKNVLHDISVHFFHCGKISTTQISPF